MAVTASDRPRGMEATGLTTDEAARRLSQVGPNQVPGPPSPTLARRLLRSLRDPLVLVLLTAFALTLVTRDVPDAAVIGLVVVVNSAIGLRQEVRADQAVRALGQLAAARAWVVRSGLHHEIPMTDVVPGDLVLLRHGDLVPADAVLVEGSGVQVDESTVTGESYPVDRSAGPDPGPGVLPGPGSSPSADRATEAETEAEQQPNPARLLSGTVVVHGRGLARVTATGMSSTVGRLASLLVSPPTATPLQRRMARLSGQLAVAVVGLSLVVLVIGLARGQSPEIMVVTTIALIVAAVPESLPLVVTVSLALAARRMAARHAVVRNLSAVETLGSVTLLATDKTGTLTEGSMTVVDTWCPPLGDPERLMRDMVLCSDATIDPRSGGIHGDPTEAALLTAARGGGVDATAMRAAYPRVAETPFDSTTKTMMTVHLDGHGGQVALSKGAPETLVSTDVLADTAEVVAQARARAESWARRGMRVLAVVERPLAAGTTERDAATGRLIGLIGLVDPLRASSSDTVARCQAAGLRVVLITGDHPATAEAVAAKVGIHVGGMSPTLRGTSQPDISGHLEGGVIARATPADKHALVGAFQQAGQIVAMTGDGVNDAPALRAADIGVAMGIRGTEVARQAADLVLTDDNLGTVVDAVEEGRRVYANIRRFLVYGLSGGCSEVLLMLAGPAVGVPLPLLPAQILWLNLLTHSFAGAGLAAQPADPQSLARGPRPPGQGPLADGMWWRVLVLAGYLATATLAVLVTSPDDLAQSAALLALGTGQLSVAWGVRTRRARPRRGAHPTSAEPPRERHLDPLVLSLGGAGALLVASTTLAPLRDLLGTEWVDPRAWVAAAAVGLGAWALTLALRARPT